VNATYFVTGGGSRRTTTFTLDGANNDEGWGRQTMLATVPVGAIQEVSVLTNAFSAEFGWTAGPAMNIVTKSGTNNLRGETLYMARPGSWQAKTFSTDGFCAPDVPSCVTPPTLQAVNPADVPDELNQFSGSVGGPLVKDKTFFFATADYTMQDRTTFLSSSLPSFLLPADGHLDYEGKYRQTLVNARVDHRLSPAHSLMVRANLDRFYDTNPNDAVAGTSAPSVARKYSRRAITGQANLTSILAPNLVNEGRFAYLNGDPVTLWEAQTLSTAYTRAGSAPFTIGQSRVSDLYGRQAQLSDTLSWSTGRHTVRFGGSLARHSSGGSGNEPGFAILGTFTFLSTTTAPPDQLTLAQVQQYTQPISYGITSYELNQWLISGYARTTFRVNNNLTLDLGLRYDRQTLTTRPATSHRASASAGIPMATRAWWFAAATGCTTRRFARMRWRGRCSAGLDGYATYTAVPGAARFSELPDRIVSAAGVRSAYSAAVAAAGARRHASRRRSRFLSRDLCEVRFELRPATELPGQVRQPAQPGDVARGRTRILPRPLCRRRLRLPALGQSRPGHRSECAVGVRPHRSRADPDCRSGERDAADSAVNGGVRQVNVLMNLGESDYHGLQTDISYRRNPKMFLGLSYTLSKATNTTEPDGNGAGPNEGNIARLGEVERGPSLLDQRHRAVFTFTYQLPYNLTAGTVTQLASARPFNAVTGIDNNGDGANNDRPVVDGKVIGKSAFRGTGTQDVSMFFEGRIKGTGRNTLLLRLEGFNLFNNGNILGRAQTNYGDTTSINNTFSQLVAVGTASNAIPALANIDPPRMVQLQVRFLF
jgi:hypothetical protein